MKNYALPTEKMILSQITENSGGTTTTQCILYGVSSVVMFIRQMFVGLMNAIFVPSEMEKRIEENREKTRQLMSHY